MQDATHSNPVVRVHGDAITRTPVSSNRVMALWHTVIGKKVVMASTGVVLVGFVIGHMLGNLKVFSGPDEINAYSRFLREVGTPELSYVGAKEEGREARGEGYPGRRARLLS